MELGNSFVLVLACILLVSGNADAKFKRGEINTEQDMAFMDTFYFTNTEDNVLEYNIRYPSTCRDKIDRVYNPDYKIILTGLDPVCHVETDAAGFNWLVCHGRFNFASRQRPQSYFVHLTNCRSNRKGLRNVTYSLHMTNGNNGLMKEFAENQKFMMETDLAFFLGYLAMIIVATRFRCVLSKKKMLHLTYRLFYSSLFFKTVCLLLLNIELSRFARTGLEMTKMQDTAEIFSCLSTILFVSVLLLVSKGFTITRAQVSLFGTLKMIVFGLVYGASYTVVFFDQRVLLDPQDIIASVTSMSAGGLIGIKFGGCIVFVYGCFFTIKNYPKKALFYLPFTLFFSVWFMTEPTYRLLSIYVYPVLQSPNIWNGIDLVLSFAGHAYFLCITRPDLLNKRFPFHLQAGKLPFNANSDESLVIPRPTLPISTVSASVADQNYSVPPTDWQLSPSLTEMMELEDDECRVPPTRRQRKALPLFSAAAMQETQPIFTPKGFVAMPRVVPHDSMKIKPLLYMDDIPKTNRSTDAVTSPKCPDSIPEQMEKCYSGEKVADPKGGLSIFSVQKQPERPNGYSFLPSITPSSESSEPSLIKSIERPEPAFLLAKSASSVGSDAMIPESKGFGNLGQITVRPADDSYMQIKAAGESGSDIVVHDRKCLNHGIPKVRLINIQPANDPYLKMKTTGASGSDAAVPDHKSMNTGTPNVRVINVRPADDPFETKTIGESRFPTQDFKSEGLAKPSDHDEPLQTKGSRITWTTNCSN
eukprot:XP_011668333.1 PREDICTED: transmembrane protein 145-like [Strongylocentrotus purpuratus]